MSTDYSKAAERFLEKILAHKDDLDFNCVDLKKPFPLDQLSAKYPQVMDWVKQVQDELNYELSEYQCSWAIVFVKKGWSLDEYNKKFGLNLTARP